MAMTLADAVAAVRAVLGEPSAIFYSDAEIEGWLSQAALDLSAKTLGVRSITPVYLPDNDLQGELEKFAHCALSGTPRVVKEQNLYFKVYPTKSAGSAPMSPGAWKSYDDTTLSGAPKRIGFRHDTGLYWTKGYPTAAALNNPTADDVRDLFFDVPDDTVTGDPSVFCLASGGSNYYFVAYALRGTSVEAEVLLAPTPPGFLKALACQLAPDGGAAQGLPFIHPRQLGHLTAETGVTPRYYSEFAGSLIFHPGGGDTGLMINLDYAHSCDDFADLPDELQPLAILAAVAYAHYKAGRFATGGQVYQQYLANVMYMRRILYPLTTDRREDFVIPDRAVMMKV